MSQFFRKGGIALNDTEWIQDFADRRLQYGVSQTKLAVMAGISREHLSRIESGKVAVTEEMKVKLLEALEKFNPEAPLTMLFDYVRIRFPTHGPTKPFARSLPPTSTSARSTSARVARTWMQPAATR